MIYDCHFCVLRRPRKQRVIFFFLALFAHSDAETKLISVSICFDSINTLIE